MDEARFDALTRSLTSIRSRRGVVQLMVEGGSRVIRSFHDEDLVDLYVFYVAPALFTGSDAVPVVGGPTVDSVCGLWRGRFAAVRP